MALKDNINCLCPTKEELDVTNYIMMEQYLNNNKIDCIIHTAAITSVEKCEMDRGLAYNVNVIGTRNIINIISKRGIKLIYISTPCVFDGKTGNYNEDSLPYPENYYGFTKAVTEELIKSSGLEYLIVRVNFVENKKYEYPKAFTDRYGTYLFADQIAENIINHISDKGIIHIVGSKKMSMFDLARLCKTDVQPMTINEYKGKTRLTMDMSMTSNRIEPIDII